MSRRQAGSDDLLLTHAGLTVECWRELGEPATARIGGRVFAGVDPKHGRTGPPQWAPMTLDGAEMLAGRELTIR